MQTPSSNKKILIAGVAAAVLLGGGYLALKPDTSPAPTTSKTSEPQTPDMAEAPEGHVELTADQIKAAAISVIAVSRGGAGEAILSGRVEAMIDARASVGAMVGGTVERVLVAPGQNVRAGQPLIRLVSGDGAALKAESEAAAATALAARQAHQRNQNLAGQGVVARQDVEASHAQLASANAMARAARARASAAGSPDAAGRMNIVSPINGVVTNVQVGPGGFVAQGAVVAEITNPARLELVFTGPPQMASQMRLGSPVRVNGPHGQFDAVITGIAAGSDLQNADLKTIGATLIRARPDKGTLPPAGSPVSGTLVTNAATDGAVSVPSEAVQTLDGATIVFVRTDRGFVATPVLVGRQAAGRSEILRGLTGSERIASANAFLLKAELAKGEAEHDH